MERMLDIKEAAKLSGMSVSWWRRAIARKEVAHHRISRRVLIDPADVQKLFSRSRVEPGAASR